MLSSPMESDAKVLEFIEEITKNADAVQRNVLAEILSQNAETEYLKRFNLNGATDPETFKSNVPIITYEDLYPLIRRIADGDRSPILSALPISEFICSSGTSSGEQKLFPANEEEKDRRVAFYLLSTPIMNKYVEELEKGKGLSFYFIVPDMETPGGLPIRSATTSVYKTNDTVIQRVFNRYTSPKEAVVCADSFQRMYVQMLCALYERQNIVWIGAAFAPSLLRAIKFLQLNWQQLTLDIRTGSLDPKVTDASVRQCMTRILRPDTDLADFIVEECAKDNWEGIIKRIWPNTKYLDVIITGAMAQYIPTLDYYSGKLPKASMTYTSSECFTAINLNPMCNPSEIRYTIMPNMAYFEFLPILETSLSKLIDLVDVEIGKEYELVVTTYSGLYRYQVGDILRVVSFHNSAPQFQFIGRKNVLLSIDINKTDDAELQLAIDNVSKLLAKFNTSLLDYTSRVDTTSIPGHYVIYLELLGGDSDVMDQCCLVIEESLNSMYRWCRVELKSISPLEIRVVEKGTFGELMDHAISRGATTTQYKVPRCVSLKHMVDLLDSRVMSRHFSPSLPVCHIGRSEHTF